MTAACNSVGVAQIGETAGLVWDWLDTNGSASPAKIARELDAPRDLVMQAMGWLAREDKLVIEEGPRSRIVSLR